MKILRRILMLLGVAGLAAAIYSAMQTPPERVDVETVRRQTLRVTVDEDGKTRIKERYIVSAPVAGRLLRIDIDPGDVVQSDARLAVIEPSDPQLLNPRDLAAARAREKAADSALQRAQPTVEQARADLAFSESELARVRKLSRSKAASQSQLEQAEREFRTSRAAFRSATFSADIARYELEQARSALMPARNAARDGDSQALDDWQFVISAPIDGKILRVLQESTAVVTPGTPLLEVGDPHDLELEIDVLSSDAVKIGAGDEVVVEHWGGEYALAGAVRLVEPSAFTKISALGVEEQRVNVIVDLIDPVDRWLQLGDGFRVEVRIVVWEEPDVLCVPGSALFRDGERWYVFAEVDGVAERREVQVGHQNSEFAQVIGGLDEGIHVIVHPSDKIADKTAVEPRVENTVATN